MTDDEAHRDEADRHAKKPCRRVDLGRRRLRRHERVAKLEVGRAEIASTERELEARRQALLTQVPMLFLMMIYTSAGLWILSLHLSQRLMSVGG